ncbi:hypothetical protein HHL28_07975 [Aerophototrophica crusticola]|uniref:Uncharacterized protein n=1 Tax=Aerophototrophica crusticola TaxID=1709002 RepID=A0A858R6G5_9PROT|nr:hypothetical protein HHL28_07975 [Rhodospirillaceae bacterium B3]
MTAEPENDSESPKRRGRIPQTAWPRILERYKAGATLSAIAREFDCTPSAISYIVRKAEAAGVGAEGGEAAPAQGELAPVTAPTPAPAPAPVVEAAPVPEPAPLAPLVESTPVPTGGEVRLPDPLRGDTQREPAARLEHRGEGPRQPRADLPPREPREPRQPLEGRPQGDRPPRPPQEGRPEMRRPGGDQPQRPPMGQGGQPQQRPFPPREGGEQQQPRGDRDQRFQNQRFERGEGGDRGQRPQQDRFRNERADRGNDRGFQNRGNRDELDYDVPAGLELSDKPPEATYPYLRHRNANRLEAAEVPSVPADQRMEAAAKAVADAYRGWKTQAPDVTAQVLTDALHELRKVVARMEIEMSASRKEEQRSMPLPNYRYNQLPAPQQSRS